MHVIKARQDPSRLQASASRSFATGSGINQMLAKTSEADARRNVASQRSVPPSTRQFAKNYAAFHGETEVSSSGLAQARAIKNSQQSESSVAKPDTRQFAKAYQAFYDVDSMNPAAMEQATAIKRGTYATQSHSAVPRSFRIKTSIREDPNFRANQARFHGTDAAPEDEIYKNYRAFYGAQTPNVNQAKHMGEAHQDQQRTLLRNKLAENAKRILNTKSFDDGFVIAKKETKTQSQILQESGFDAKAAETKPAFEPASYQTHASTGTAAFNYARNPKVDKVTKTDPPIKNLDRVRYNIITGSLQQWF